MILNPHLVYVVLLWNDPIVYSYFRMVYKAGVPIVSVLKLKTLKYEAISVSSSGYVSDRVLQTNKILKPAQPWLRHWAHELTICD